MHDWPVCGLPLKAQESYCCRRPFLFGLRRVHRSKEASGLRFVFEYGPTPGIKLICHWKIDTLVETFIRQWCCHVGRNSFTTCWQIVTTIRQHYSLYWLTISCPPQHRCPSRSRRVL